MNDNAWISELKVGDLVFVSRPYGQAPELAKVERVTGTMIITLPRSLRFRKQDGGSVGSDCWPCRYLIQDSPEVRQKVELERLTNKCDFYRNNLNIPRESEALRALIAAMEPYVPAENRGVK